jgi:cell division transport system permease protein
MIDRVRFVLHETWESLLRNATMQAAAISTACIALILLGGAGMALYKLDAAASALPSQFEAEVFLKMSATREQALQLKAELESWQEVERVVLTPREVAWEEQKRKLAADVNLADIPNPLPDKLTVRVRDPEQLPAVAERIQQSPLVDEVIDSRAELQTVLSLSRLVRWVGLGAGGLLLLAALILIYNTVRLTIFSRQREVRVMALVGATLRSIRLPFILEGMTQGLIGGALAATLTLLAAALLSDYMTAAVGVPARLAAGDAATDGAGRAADAGRADGRAVRVVGDLALCAHLRGDRAHPTRVADRDAAADRVRCERAAVLADWGGSAEPCRTVGRAARARRRDGARNPLGVAPAARADGGSGRRRAGLCGRRVSGAAAQRAGGPVHRGRLVGAAVGAAVGVLLGWHCAAGAGRLRCSRSAAGC